MTSTALLQLTSDFSVLDILRGTAGIKLAHNGWLRNVARRGADGRWPTSVVETMTLRIMGSDGEDLASKVQALDEKVKLTGDFAADPILLNRVYLQARIGGETSIYRAALLEGATQIGSHLYSPPADIQSTILEYPLSVSRTPFWEPLNTSSLTGQSVNLLAGFFEFGSLTGDVPARIAKMLLSGGETPGLTEFWMGFRSNLIGAVSQFSPVLECEKAGTLGANTATGSDSTASNGSKLVVSLSSGEDLASRMEGTLLELVTGFPTGQLGLFQVLLRAKATGTRSYQVRLRNGWRGADIWRNHSRVTISGTDWRLYAMGTAQIPTAVLQGVAAPNILYSSLALDAGELVSGTGNLDLDCLLLIPKSEGFCYIKDVLVEPTGESTLATTERDEFLAWSTGDSASVAEIQPDNFALPINSSGILVVAGQSNTAHALSDDVFIRVDYLPRWLTLRGSE